MKIRNGFVSNSSSSSFILYGKMFNDEEELINALKVFYGDIKNIPGYNEEEEYFDYSDFNDTSDDIEVISDCDYGVHAIGIYPWNMGDNETKLQFMERVAKTLSKFRIKQEELELIEEVISG